MSQTTLTRSTLKSQSFRFICVCFCTPDWTCPLVLLLLSPQSAAVVWFDWSRELQDGSRLHSRLSLGEHGVSSWGWLRPLPSCGLSLFSSLPQSFSNKTHIDYLISLVALIIILFLWGKAKLYDFIFTYNIFSRRK